jgi:hypothetical protein
MYTPPRSYFPCQITLPKGPSTLAPVLSMKHQSSALRTTARPSENYWARSNRGSMAMRPDVSM